VDGELKDIAKGTIIQTNSTIMHHKEMVSEVFKVWLARVLLGCKDMDPPTQPQGADEHKTLEGFFGWILTWPKTQIRLVKAQQVTQPPPRMPCLEQVTEPPPCLAPVSEPLPCLVPVTEPPPDCWDDGARKELVPS
jgi:hypothetical protein